jgi:hypothetical protein
MVVNVPLRLLEERKDTSRQLATAEKSVPRSSEPEPSPELPTPRGPVRVGSIDDLASTLVNQLSGTIGTPRGTVAVRPFTFRNTQIGSEFSRYFRSILEARASRLAKWSIVSSEDGSGKVLASMGAPLEYEVTGTYWAFPGVVRVFALLRNPRTFVVAAQAEAMVSNAELHKLGIALLPRNIKQVLDDGRRVGTPVPATGDLKLELFTNKGVENLVFSDGDTLEISVRVNKPCTVRAFYHAADGRKYLLTGEADLKIEPSRVNSIVQIRMVECAPPFGAEILQAFATTGAFESIRTKYVENGFYELQEKVEDAMIATRGIKKLAGASGLVEKRVVVTTVAR